MNRFWNSKKNATRNSTPEVGQIRGHRRHGIQQWALRAALFAATITIAALIPALALASVEGSLLAVQAKLVGTILPLAAICGLVIAGFSFVAGHPNARAHLSLAIMGAVVGFGAESIVALIRSLIQ